MAWYPKGGQSSRGCIKLVTLLMGLATGHGVWMQPTFQNTKPSLPWHRTALISGLDPDLGITRFRSGYYYIQIRVPSSDLYPDPGTKMQVADHQAPRCRLQATRQGEAPGWVSVWMPQPAQLYAACVYQVDLTARQGQPPGRGKAGLTYAAWITHMHPGVVRQHTAWSTHVAPRAVRLHRAWRQQDSHMQPGVHTCAPRGSTPTHSLEAAGLLAPGGRTWPWSRTQAACMGGSPCWCACSGPSGVRTGGAQHSTAARA